MNLPNMVIKFAPIILKYQALIISENKKKIQIFEDLMQLNTIQIITKAITIYLKLLALHYTY